MRRRTTIAALVAVPLVALGPVLPAQAAPGSTVRVSVTSDGLPANGYSDGVAISADGSTISFVSQSALLNPSGNPGTAFYAHDRRTGTTELVSVDPDGQQFPSSGLQATPVLSADGRYALFTWASSPDDQTTMHLYRRDLLEDQTVLVSTTPTGAAPNDEVTSFTLDGSGTLAAFTSPATDILDDGLGGGLFLRDLTTGVTTRVTGAAWDPVLSADGGTLVYSAAPGPASAPVIWVRDLDTGTNERLLPTVDDESYSPSVSQDGRRIVFLSYGTGIDPSDTNPSYDWFLADRDSGLVGLVTRTSTGEQAFIARAFLAADGRHVGLLGQPLDATGRTGFANLYVKDLATGTLEYTAVDSSGTPVYASLNTNFNYLSGDARYIAWSSRSPDFVPDDTDDFDDVFVHDNGSPQTTVSGSGTVTTDTGGIGATWEQPMQTTVQSPSGAVSITQLGSTVAPTAPSGYEVLGQAVDISADPAPAGQWLTVTFRLDAPTLATTTPLDDVTVSRNGVPLSRCATPDAVGPCVQSVARAADADVVIVVHTPQASRWVPLVRVAAPDTTPPTITIGSPTPDAMVTLGTTLIASYTCSDGESGVETCSGSVPSGHALETSQVGQFALTVTARDAAGNQAEVSRTYRVVYDWQGFRDPVDEAPVVNKAKAGTTIPLAFSLGGDRGLVVMSGAPLDAPIACDRKAPTDRIERTVASGAGTLTYDPSTSMYTYGYAIPTTWTKTCRSVTLRLADGTTHTALLTVVN